MFAKFKYKLLLQEVWPKDSELHILWCTDGQGASYKPPKCSIENCLGEIKEHLFVYIYNYISDIKPNHTFANVKYFDIVTTQPYMISSMFYIYIPN